MGGILDSVANVFSDPAKSTPPVGPGGVADNFSLAFNQPQLMQLFSLSFQLGEDPSDLFKPYIVEKVGYDQIEANEDPSLLKIGTRRQSATYIDMGKLAPALPALREKLENKAVKQFQATYEKLAKVPALAPIFKEAGGGGSTFQGQVSDAFGLLGEFALGKAAKTGLLNNPLVQKKALAPFAIDLAKYSEAGQKNALAQALGLSGAPGLMGTGANAGLSAGSLQAFQPAVMNAAGLGFQASVQNASNFFNDQQLRFAQLKAADASLTQNLSGLFGGISPGKADGQTNYAPGVAGSGQLAGGSTTAPNTQYHAAWGY